MESKARGDPRVSPCGQGLPKINAEGERGTLVQRPVGQYLQQDWVCLVACKLELFIALKVAGAMAAFLPASGQ